MNLATDIVNDFIYYFIKIVTGRVQKPFYWKNKRMK